MKIARGMFTLEGCWIIFYPQRLTTTCLEQMIHHTRTFPKSFHENVKRISHGKRKKYKWVNGSFNPFFSTSALFRQHTDMTNFILTPAAIKAENNKYTSTDDATMQMKIPQAVVEHSKETFNDKTRKSLLKLNLFLKRLKWFNIFADTQTPTEEQKSAELNQWWVNFTLFLDLCLVLI